MGSVNATSVLRCTLIVYQADENFGKSRNMKRTKILFTSSSINIWLIPISRKQVGLDHGEVDRALTRELRRPVVDQELLLFFPAGERVKVLPAFVDKELGKEGGRADGSRRVRDHRVLGRPLVRVLFRMELAQPERERLGLEQGHELEAVKVVAGRQVGPDLVEAELGEVFRREAPVVEVHRHVRLGQDVVNVRTR